MCKKERRKLQLVSWLRNQPYHNEVDDECLPDFSCCGGNPAPHHMRHRYFKAFAENDWLTLNNIEASMSIDYDFNIDFNYFKYQLSYHKQH